MTQSLSLSFVGSDPAADEFREISTTGPTAESFYQIRPLLCQPIFRHDAMALVTQLTLWIMRRVDSFGSVCPVRLPNIRQIKFFDSFYRKGFCARMKDLTGLKVVVVVVFFILIENKKKITTTPLP
ncbi:MAG: hypothetical protein ACPG6R_11810 [Aequoribacter sp.]|uniref:hypothetical protein n=1 Tax=Aequoribacter sp. TaxID=2847771 RepID=UPI003C5F6DE3